tara:strand:- start:2889 stop:3260 length:372 start_codon:yes stop_codon:yes gene_type:complete
MEYDLIQSIGSAIDNVYNNYAENSSRRTLAKLHNDQMTISFMTILNVAREQDLHIQMQHLQKEANDMIRSRLNLIKSQFKSEAGRPLKTKKCGTSDNIETLTVSPYSPHRKLKYTYSLVYEVS